MYQKMYQLIFQWFIIVFGWASLLSFIVLVAIKYYKIATLPLNLRWEVYPVPHETGEKRYYGGSYMEQLDWAMKPRSTSLVAELAEMGSEIFLLKRVREHNPYHLWPFSMAMHWGLYLLLLWIGFLAVRIYIPTLTSLSVLVGIMAFILGIIGTLGLIVKRATKRELSLYTAPIDYFNLMFLAAIFGMGFLSWLADPFFSHHQSYIGSLLLLRPTSVSPMVVTMFLLLQVFAIYMPFSKLIHYVMKHFTFSETLWDNELNVRGSPRDKRIQRQLSYIVNWSGPHIVRGKTWLEDMRVASVGEEE